MHHDDRPYDRDSVCAQGECAGLLYALAEVVGDEALLQVTHGGRVVQGEDSHHAATSRDKTQALLISY